MAESVFELRTYSIASGRRADYDERTRTMTGPLFRELGFPVTSHYWESAEDPETIVYGILWPSRDEMARKWDEFSRHPVWLASQEKYDQPTAMLDDLQVQVLVVGGQFGPNGGAGSGPIPGL